MSNSRPTLGDLEAAYKHSLEKQIVGRGTNLTCSDQELWDQVEALLKEGSTDDTHCLGLDPLRLMEESLAQAAAVSTPSAGRVRGRAGLQGLAKAFEVLEQAALNLYLSPWREEYKVVKMYSGMFTHCIKPVLSMPQIEKVFGLLGYRPGSSRQQQLHLQSSRTSTATPEDLLRLSCAFFLARCECCLLQKVLGSHVGEADWELSVVRERQKGHSVQFALENTIKTLKVQQPVTEPLDADVDVDLYTDVLANGGQKEIGGVDDEGPRSLIWASPLGSPKAVKMHSNEIMSLPSTSASPPTGEHSCISMLNCQLTKTSPVESNIHRSSSVNKRQSKQTCNESKLDGGDQPQLHSLQLEEVELGMKKAEANQLCSCLQNSSYPTMKHCAKCKLTDSKSCAVLGSCHVERRPDVAVDSMAGSGSVSAQNESLRVSDRSAAQIVPSGSTVMSSLVRSDCPKPKPKAITYHECCNLAQLDPRLLCHSCCVFHSESCKEREYCKSHHMVKELGVCECGRLCSRKPLVLCRYCGSEYCRDCWYRTPLECTCGQTFDQSSSV
ncbi:spermatogenesis associated 2-like [Betta splendens]|uniref:Spermatogenesis associated 2-like n=1 Tax=Betta splendens TaxID=158456 RepID=A0A6P7MT72_BETSP|nr:spermatogenesis associated 2-like [Betta splendens]XP_055365556.1 spermatogenesis associated 2-like [Betta splendens]